MQLDAYLTLSGRCEEALEFYKEALGGSYEIMRFEGTPMAANLPEDWKSKVIHSTFRFDGGQFMASDSMPGPKPTGETNVSLSLATKDTAHAERVFTALSQGGTIEKPLEKTFWSSRYGEKIGR